MAGTKGILTSIALKQLFFTELTSPQFPGLTGFTMQNDCFCYVKMRWRTWRLLPMPLCRCMSKRT